MAVFVQPILHQLLRLYPGIGFGYQHIHDHYGKYTFEGIAFPYFNFRAGYNLSSKMALYLRNTTSLFSDGLNINDNKKYEFDDNLIYSYQIALGLRYYFKDSHSYYFGAETGLENNTIYTISVDDNDQIGVGGFVFNFIVGREISKNLELEFEYSNLMAADSGDAGNVIFFSIVFHL